MTDQISFETGMRLLFNSMLGGVHTAFPGIVQAYDAVTMCAEIQPCLMRKYFSADAPTPLPTLLEVPVLFTSTGSLHIIAPPDPGSYVLVVCCERALDAWLTSGGVVDPANPRKFDLSDAVAIPGLFPLPNSAAVTPPVTAGAIEIRNAAGTSVFSISQTEIGLQCGSAIPAVDYAVKFDALKIAFDSLKLSFNTHVHAKVTAGTDSTAVPTTLATADMALAKVANVRLP